MANVPEWFDFIFTWSKEIKAVIRVCSNKDAAVDKKVKKINEVFKTYMQKGRQIGAREKKERKELILSKQDFWVDAAKPQGAQNVSAPPKCP